MFLSSHATEPDLMGPAHHLVLSALLSLITTLRSLSLGEETVTNSMCSYWQSNGAGPGTQPEDETLGGV